VHDAILEGMTFSVFDNLPATGSSSPFVPPPNVPATKAAVNGEIIKMPDSIYTQIPIVWI